MVLRHSVFGYCSRVKQASGSIVKRSVILLRYCWIGYNKCTDDIDKSAFLNAYLVVRLDGA